MIGLLQRVTESSVSVDGEVVGAIQTGLMVLIGLQPEDDEAVGRRLIDRLVRYRVFADNAGKMNKALTDINGGLLLVPQFTLAADTSSGSRPGFSTAMPPAAASPLFEAMVAYAKQQWSGKVMVQSGQFSADMQVSLTNDGPVSFILRQ